MLGKDAVIIERGAAADLYRYLEKFSSDSKFYADMVTKFPKARLAWDAIREAAQDERL